MIYVNINTITNIGADAFLSAFAVVILNLYLVAFFKYTNKKIWFILSVITVFSWHFFANMYFDTPYMIRTIINILLSIIVSILVYEGSLWKKTMFSISFHTFWLLMQAFCSYVFPLLSIPFHMGKFVGEAIPQVAFLIIFLTFRKVFRENRTREPSKSSTILLSLIPIGSMYVVNNTLQLSYLIGTMKEQIRSIVSLLIVLVINIIIFYIYLKLAEEFNLRKCMAAYKQQIDLCERNQKVRERSMLEVRNLRHNMKNNLIKISTYARQQKYEEMEEYIEELLQSISKGKHEIANSGNIIIDSILNYRYSQARTKEIKFSVEMKIPIQLPFEGADLCLILGNALQNAEEATEKLPAPNRFVHVRLTFDKGNLLILVKNSHKECASKKEETNPDIGLQSMYQSVEKYHGTVMINCQKEIQELKILLYQL